MARTKRTVPYERLNLELHPEVRQRLEALRDETRADSVSQVVRRALAVYELLIAQEAAGSSLVVRTSDGREKEVLLAER